jgi:hypothetical protein
MNTKRIRELCHAVSFDDLDRSSRHDILEILLAEEDRLTAPAAPVVQLTDMEIMREEGCSDEMREYLEARPAPVAPPTTGSPSVTMREVEDVVDYIIGNYGNRVASMRLTAWLRENGMEVLPDAGEKP